MTSLKSVIAQYRVYIVAALSGLAVAAQVLWPHLEPGTAFPGFVFPLLAASGIAVYRVNLAAIGSGTGWKSYATAAALAACGAAQALGIAVPPQAYALLGAAGLGSLGHALAKVN